MVLNKPKAAYWLLLKEEGRGFLAQLQQKLCQAIQIILSSCPCICLRTIGKAVE